MYAIRSYYDVLAGGANLNTEFGPKFVQNGLVGLIIGQVLFADKAAKIVHAICFKLETHPWSLKALIYFNLTFDFGFVFDTKFSRVGIQNSNEDFFVGNIAIQ